VKQDALEAQTVDFILTRYVEHSPTQDSVINAFKTLRFSMEDASVL
jgi:hypothetical protein